MALRTAVTIGMVAVGVAVDVGKLEVYQDAGNCTSEKKMKVDEVLLDTCFGEGSTAMKLTCNNSVLTRTMYNWTNTSAVPDCAEQLEAVELSASTCASGIDTKGSCGTYSAPSANSDVMKREKFGTDTCGSAATETAYMIPGSCDADGEGMYTKWMCDAGTVWMAQFFDSACANFAARTHYAACSPMDSAWQTMTCISKYVKVTRYNANTCSGTVNSTFILGDWCAQFGTQYIKFNAQNQVMTYSDAACSTLTGTENLEDCGKCEVDDDGLYSKVECVGGYANIVNSSSSDGSSSSGGSSDGGSSSSSSGGSSDGSSSGGSSDGGNSSDGGSSDGGNSSDGGSSSSGSSGSSSGSSTGGTTGTAVVSATSHSGLAASVVLATVAVAFAVSK